MFYKTTIGLVSGVILSVSSLGTLAQTEQPTDEVTNETRMVSPASTILRQKLAKIPQFSATFAQQVFDQKGGLIQESNGYVKVNQPNQFRWVTNEPDESVIVSDGKAVWVYNPFVEQVSVMDLDTTVKQSPLWLIANQSDSAWQAFVVSAHAQNNRFTIVPKDTNSLTRQIALTFSGDALSSISLSDSQGQSSVFKLSDFNQKQKIETTQFMFKLPAGVDLDDQRAIQ